MSHPKIAVITLCRRMNAGGLIGRAKSIKNHVISKFPYDHLVFEDADGIRGSVASQVCDIIPNARFINVWDNPTDNLKESHKAGSVIGYNGMCLFYAMEMLHYLKDYDYYVRLDADCQLHSDLNIDNFINNGDIFGHSHKMLDNHKPTKLTLLPAIKEYIDGNKINTLCSEKEINCWNYYNNFHITKLDFWRQKEVTDFLEYIYNQGGIRDHRWGDSTIQANAVRMFCPKEKIIQLNDLKYRHDSHRWQNF
jgi:hypothetical protein